MIKRARLVKQIDFYYNSGTSVHNYMLDDPILDYYSLLDKDLYKDSNTITNTNNEQKTENKFLNFILEQGKLFEENVIQKLKEKISLEHFVQIAHTQDDIKNNDFYEKTLEAIENKVPIIYQGVLHDHDTKTYGCPDLLVRNDFIYNIANRLLPINQKETYYVIVDIKFNTLRLFADGFTLSNYGRSIANKGQLMIYNRILSKIQNKEPEYMYILGRGNTYTKKSVKYSSNNCFDTLGHVAYKDTFLQTKVDDALKWLDYLKNNYKEPNFQIPYPNMSNTYDAPYHSRKKEYAKSIEELTLLWNVGYRARTIAHSRSVYKLSDPNLNSGTLDITNSKAFLIDKIIEINNNNNKNRLKIYKEESIVLRERCDVEFFIDFEMINDIFDDFSKIPEITNTSYVFMIGVYYVSNENNNLGNEKEYKCFTLDELSKEAEYELFSKFNSFILEKSANKTYKCYHWGSFEQYVYKSLFGQELLDKLNLCNLLDVFKNDHIVVKGSYTYSLKDIANAFYENGFIDKKYKLENIHDGLTAMILAQEYYQNKKTSTENMITNNIMQNIQDYNQLDCEILYDVLEYIRKSF